MVAQKVDDPDGNFSTGEMDTDTIKKVPVFTSLEACLKEVEIEAISICVHTNLHYTIAKEALDSGLHVMLEKPFVLDVEEGRELIQLASEKHKILMVAHVLRFMSPYKKLAEFIESGKYGKLKFLSLGRFSGVPLWGQWKEKQKDFGSSGGALFDLVIHDIDFAAFVLGEPKKIESNILPGKLSKHDYLNATWKYPSKDLTVKIEGGNIFPPTFPFRAEYTAVFENATVSFSTNTGESIFIDTNSERISKPAGDANEGYYDEIDLFADAIISGKLDEHFNPESALRTIELCYRHI